MLVHRGFSLLLIILLTALCTAPCYADSSHEEILGTKNTEITDMEIVSNLIIGFAKPKWTYNGDDWKTAADQYRSRGNYDDALHAYDKALENYGVALKEKEVEWSTRDARYNRMKDDDLVQGLNKMDLAPHAQENIRQILASKTVIYKKKGENDKALDCVNSLLVNEPNSYSLLNEKASLLSKLGRTAEAAEVQKMADANKPVDEPYDQGGCLIATATFGSPLAAEVQQLRDFRQNTIYSSAAGTEFMFAFNSWYYSFSPYVADFIRANSWTRPPMQRILTPLISILSLAKSASLAFGPHAELSAVIAGLIASSLIGLVYLFPIILILQVIVRHYQRSVTSPVLVKFLLGLSIFGILLLLCGYFFSITLFHLVGSSLFVISVFFVSAFGAVLVCDRWIGTRKGKVLMN